SRVRSIASGGADLRSKPTTKSAISSLSFLLSAIGLSSARAADVASNAAPLAASSVRRSMFVIHGLPTYMRHCEERNDSKARPFEERSDEAISAACSCTSEARLLRFARNDC